VTNKLSETCHPTCRHEAWDHITLEVVQTRLGQAGFRDISMTPVPHTDNLPWNIDWTMIEAQKNDTVPAHPTGYPLIP
jgi:hypothetical protein